jgi:hypothetical protein
MSFILGIYRQVANETVAPIPIPRFADLVNQSFGGALPGNSTPANWTNIIYNSVMIYPDMIGVLAFVLLSAMPFGMMWIAHGNMKMAGIIGLFTGLFLFRYLPAGFQAGAIMCIVISAVATVWGLMK